MLAKCFYNKRKSTSKEKARFLLCGANKMSKMASYTITANEIVNAIEGNYEIACRHSILCSKVSTCSCYGNIIAKARSRILFLTKGGTFPTDSKEVLDIFQSLCKHDCEPQGALQSRRKIVDFNICRANLNKFLSGFTTYSSTANRSKALAFMIEAVLSGHSDVIGFRKKHGTIQKSLGCFGKTAHGANLFYRTLHSRVHLRKGKRVSNFLETYSRIGDKHVKIKISAIVDEFILSNFPKLKCSHGKLANRCSTHIWSRRNSSTLSCSKAFSFELLDFVYDQLKIAEKVENEGTQAWANDGEFGRKFCLRCQGCVKDGKTSSLEISQEKYHACRRSFYDSYATFSGLVMFFTELALKSVESEVLAQKKADVYKASPWLLACPKDVLPTEELLPKELRNTNTKEEGIYNSARQSAAWNKSRDVVSTEVNRNGMVRTKYKDGTVSYTCPDKHKTLKKQVKKAYLFSGDIK